MIRRTLVMTTRTLLMIRTNQRTKWTDTDIFSIMNYVSKNNDPFGRKVVGIRQNCLATVLSL